ncbi:MAG: hypothetical protein ABTA16_04285 [Niallia sp.]
MFSFIENTDASDFITLFTAIIFLLSISSTVLTFINNRKDNNDLTDDYQDKVKTIVKTLSDQINLGVDGMDVSYKSGQSDKFTSIEVAPKFEKPNDEKLIELAVHQTFMESHQKQAINHSRIQFYTGLIMSILGFILIIYVVFIALSSDNSLISAITIIGSIVFEGISILFLKESHKLRQSAKEYHDNLSENNKQFQAIKIAESIEDPDIKSAIKAQLALHMIGIHSENIDTTKIIEAMNKE